MICQKCNQRPASVFISQTVGHETTQAHLCEVCAREQTQAYGGLNPFSMNPFAAMNDFFNNFMSWESNIVEVQTPGRATTPTVEPQLQCPYCGYQLSAFRQNGRLGCTKCYEAFKTVLYPLLASIHGNVQHAEESTEKFGKAPPGEPFVEKTEGIETSSVLQLREKLKTAIQNEKFEEAAQIRDEIQKLKGRQDV